MNLPKNERRTVESKKAFKKIWLYGQPFSGKTYLANKFPNVLMLNTDGNVKFVDAPFVAIKDIVTIEGRVTRRTLSWDVFKNAIDELEKKQNTFETIVVDLVEDTYEACRLWCYDKLGIEHESDNGFKAWDYVKTEFLSTIKRLLNLDYNIILISHEDTSKDITKKTGDKVTAIKPNLQDKASLKLAGMVDIVGRVMRDGETRVISFKTNEVIFGGGRLNIAHEEIPCTYEALMGIYGEETETVPQTAPVEDKSMIASAEEKPTEEIPVEEKPIEETPVEEAPKPKRRRRTKAEMEAERAKQAEAEPEKEEAVFEEEKVDISDDSDDEPPVETKTRTRKARR